MTVSGSQSRNRSMTEWISKGKSAGGVLALWRGRYERTSSCCSSSMIIWPSPLNCVECGGRCVQRQHINLSCC